MGVERVSEMFGCACVPVTLSDREPPAALNAPVPVIPPVADSERVKLSVTASPARLTCPDHDPVAVGTTVTGTVPETPSAVRAIDVLPDATAVTSPVGVTVMQVGSWLR